MQIIETNLNWNGTLPDEENNPQKIVLHHAEASNCTVYDIHQWHLGNGWAGIGYHYFIRKDGTIYRGRKEGWRGAHCPPANYNSIGICFEGNYMTETMPQAQLQAGLELIADIKNRYGFNAIYGHKELFSTECPGDNFPLDFLKTTGSKSNKIVVNVVSNSQSNNNNGGFEEMDKVYKNGSTPEPVFMTEQCTQQIGSLDSYELANAIADVDGKIVVLYNTSNGKKVGFVKYRAGL